MRHGYAIALGVLAFAFFLRVLGQALVAFLGVTFLPPMARWYSGAVPYPVLLPLQIVILLAQAKISVDFWRGSGFFAVRRPGTGQFLLWFSGAYFLAMVVRYVVTMYLYPEQRWFTGTIPIFFHWVLAAYLFVLSRYHRSVGAEASPAK